MGYHVTILRTEGKQQIPIALEEFGSAANSIPALQFHSEEKCADLAGDDNKFRPTLFWTDGEIWSKNPDEAVIAVMVELASHLNARVRGDHMETYRTPVDTYYHPDDEEDILEEQQSHRRHVIRRRIWNAVRIILIILAILYVLKKEGLISF